MGAFKAEILADSPSFYVELEEKTGAHVDLSASALSSATVLVTSQGLASPDAGWSGVGSGDEFDGTDDYVSWGDNANFFPGAQGSYSVMWVGEADTIDSTFRRIASHETASDGWVLSVQNNGVQTELGWRFERKGTSASVYSSSGFTSAIVPTTGQTYMIHGVCEVTATNVATMRVYVDGALAKERTGLTIANMADPAAPLQLGRRHYDATRFFDGRTFAFALFPQALSAGRISAHYAGRDIAGTVDPAQDTHLTVTIGNRFRPRIRIQEAGGAGVATAYKLRVSKNGGAYADVATGSGDIRVVDSTQFTHGAATSTLLTGGTGTFVAGEGLDTSGTSGSISVGASGHTELEWSLILFSGTAGDTYDLRVTRADGTPLDTYAATPRITAA